MNKTLASGRRSGLAIGDLSALERRRARSRPRRAISTLARCWPRFIFFWIFFVPRMVDGTVDFDLAFGFTAFEMLPAVGGRKIQQLSPRYRSLLIVL
jgi:hypothetical protein